jgi:hypothetical protein
MHVYSSPWHQCKMISFSCIAEVPILQQLVGVLLLVLFSDWSSVLRNKRRCALPSWYIFVFACSFPLLSVPYFQFFVGSYDFRCNDQIYCNPGMQVRIVGENVQCLASAKFGSTKVLVCVGMDTLSSNCLLDVEKRWRLVVFLSSPFLGICLPCL